MRAFLLTAHEPTEAQREDLTTNWGVEALLLPPDHLRPCLVSVPENLDSLRPHVRPLAEWLDREGQSGDLVWVQGEFGLTVLLVQHCWQKGMIPVYAASRRTSRETRHADGSVQSLRVFQHTRFRRYERP